MGFPRLGLPRPRARGPCGWDSESARRYRSRLVRRNSHSLEQPRAVSRWPLPPAQRRRRVANRLFPLREDRKEWRSARPLRRMDLEPPRTLRFPHSRSLSEDHIFEHAGRSRENHMMVGILLLMLSAHVLVLAADSPIAPGSKPKNEGKIGAGE